jgi:hypothetical protein
MEVGSRRVPLSFLTPFMSPTQVGRLAVNMDRSPLKPLNASIVSPFRSSILQQLSHLSPKKKFVLVRSILEEVHLEKSSIPITDEENEDARNHLLSAQVSADAQNNILPKH